MKALGPGISGPEDFIYSRRSHFEAFRGMDLALYGYQVDPDTSGLKRYQDLLALAFINANIPPGSRILEVGGGDSRILPHFVDRYECWNVDKLEGLGNGPLDVSMKEVRLVRDYIGCFNPELPDGYFDLVFSISVLEHTPEDPDLFSRILDDLNRLRKPGAFSLHLFDVVFKKQEFCANKILPYFFEKANPIAAMPDVEKMESDPDLYFMSEVGYDAFWKPYIGLSYENFGRPFSFNIVWL